jgi:beta-aspartyl-peptidase (threonine type)
VGVIPKNLKPEEIAAYHAALDGALAEGIRRAERGESALDIAEAVVRILEDEPRFNAGRGAAFTADGTDELDACVMVGSGLKTGAVAGVKTVRHPVSLARLVMEKTRHVLLAADGAEAFADLMKVERVPNTWFDTELRRGYLEEWRAAQKTHAAVPVRGENAYGTVGCVVRDAKGELAAATSTGGLTGKRWGGSATRRSRARGTFADARCAVSCSGTGEVFIRHGVAREVSNRMRHFGEDATTAARRVIDALEPGDGGIDRRRRGRVDRLRLQHGRPLIADSPMRTVAGRPPSGRIRARGLARPSRPVLIPFPGTALHALPLRASKTTTR